MINRLCQTSLTAACALYMLLAAFNNLTDYGSNYQLVEHVLGMDTTFPGNAGMWRAITNPLVYHVFYASIIVWELATALLLSVGTWQLWRSRHASVAHWRFARQWASAGLTLGMLLWFLAFITVGGEWFLMWQSTKWNGLGPALRMFTVMGVVLIYLNQPEQSPEEIK